MRAKIIASIKRRGFDVHYWAERDAADKLTIVHRSELYSRAENAPERGWRGKIEFYSKRRRGRYVLQVVTGVGKEHRLEFNLYEGADENVFVIRYINLKEIRDVDFVPALPLPLPDTEEKFWQFATEWAQSLRDLKPAVPAVPARRRGRPRGDARIAAQQRKRVRLFLAEYLGAGKTIEEATATVVNKYGVNRRTVARDRKAHEDIERLPPQIYFGGIGLALEIWRCLKDWRPPPRYSLSSAPLAQYYGATG